MRYILFTLLLVSRYYAQGNYPGDFSLGHRTTLSTFNHDKSTSIGLGGQFRIQISKKLNSEWFADYFPTIEEKYKKRDYHIGWSLMYDLSGSQADKKVIPYFLIGHCFDLSHFQEKQNIDNSVKRFSSAIQGGFAVRYRVTNFWDVSVNAQYMTHLGKDIHAHEENGELTFESNGSRRYEGHLLFSLTSNFVILNLKDPKKFQLTSENEAKRRNPNKIGNQGKFQAFGSFYALSDRNFDIIDGIQIGGGFNYFFTKNLAVRGTLAKFSNRVDVQTAFPLQQTKIGFGTQYLFREEKQAQPYIAADAILAKNNLYPIGRTEMMSAFNIGAGVQINLHRYFYFYGEIGNYFQKNPFGPGNHNRGTVTIGMGLQI